MKTLFDLFNYGAVLFLILFGIYVMITEKNLVRKVIGMGILQTGVILFYITVSYKWGSAIPILPHDGTHAPINPDLYANPLPHALMLTAIVVGVSTLGLALVLVISIHRSHQTIEEDEILRRLESLK